MTKWQKFQKILVVFLIAVGMFCGGYYVGKRGYVFEIRKNPPKIEVINRAPSEQTVDFSLFWQVWNAVSSEYLNRPVDAEKMLYGAIEGMIRSLDDPYSSFLPPEINAIISNALSNAYEGIGAELDIRDNQLIVVSPLDGSPAKSVGIQPGDKILEIEGESTAGISLTEAVAKIRGHAGTVSTLTLKRGDGEPFVVRIKRARIVLDSVTWEDKGSGIAYIRVSRFAEDTNKEWDKVVKEINAGMPSLDAIIIDVRGNPGGYLTSPVYIAGDFMKNKVVVYQESSLGKQTPLDTKRAGSFLGVPLYVLIDGGSASASEILAAALRENADAVLVGVKTFGKGTIQDAKEYEDGSGLHLTVAKWLTSKKEWVHETGIEPDEKIELTEEDIQSKNDKQLMKALELAKAGL